MGSQRVGHDWVTELNWGRFCFRWWGSWSRLQPECKSALHVPSTGAATFFSQGIPQECESLNQIRKIQWRLCSHHVHWYPIGLRKLYDWLQHWWDRGIVCACFSVRNYKDTLQRLWRIRKSEALGIITLSAALSLCWYLTTRVRVPLVPPTSTSNSRISRSYSLFWIYSLKKRQGPHWFSISYCYKENFRDSP